MSQVYSICSGFSHGGKSFGKRSMRGSVDFLWHGRNPNPLWPNEKGSITKCDAALFNECCRGKWPI
jgi:hypothetical protein